MSITEVKLECMDSFYSCIDRDICSDRFEDYETSFAQVFVNEFPFISDIEKVIWCFTMVIRFARSGMLLCKNGILEEETLKSIDFMKKTSQFSEFDGKDLNLLMKDLNEVEDYFEWLEKKRNK